MRSGEARNSWSLEIMATPILSRRSREGRHPASSTRTRWPPARHTGLPAASTRTRWPRSGHRPRRGRRPTVPRRRRSRRRKNLHQQEHIHIVRLWLVRDERPEDDDPRQVAGRSGELVDPDESGRDGRAARRAPPESRRTSPSVAQMEQPGGRSPAALKGGSGTSSPPSSPHRCDLLTSAHPNRSFRHLQAPRFAGRDPRPAVRPARSRSARPGSVNPSDRVRSIKDRCHTARKTRSLTQQPAPTAKISHL